MWHYCICFGADGIGRFRDGEPVPYKNKKSAPFGADFLFYENTVIAIIFDFPVGDGSPVPYNP